VNEPLLARRIKDALDAGLKLPPEVLARLAVARERALERPRAASGELALAGGRAGARVSGPTQRLTRALLPVALLVAAAIGFQQWQEQQRAARAAQRIAELEETDTRVLTGDLPIKAYLDEDFQAWLKRSSQ
jgi:hypothetical protein